MKLITGPGLPYQRQRVETKPRLEGYGPAGILDGGAQHRTRVRVPISQPRANDPGG